MCDMCGSSGTQTVTQESSSKPWWLQSQFLVPGFQQAANHYGAADQQNYIGMTPTAQAGYQGMVSDAQNPNSALNTAIGGLRDTAGGNFLATGNPMLGAAISRAQQPVIDQWRTQIAPGVDATFSGAGRYGSGLYAQARNASEDTLARELGGISTDMTYADYNNERGRMLQASALLPQVANQPNQNLVTAGNAYQADQQANQGWDYQRLLQYMGIVGGNNWGGSSTSTSTQPVNSDPLGQALGYGLTVAGLF
jgi:hypothetical protein